MSIRRAVHAVLTVGVLSLVLSRCRETTTPEPRSGVAADVGSVAAPPEVLVGAGDIARCDRTFDEATAALLDDIPGTVFVLGDNAYSSGTAAQYECFNASWGRHKARIRPAAGDYDYGSSSTASPYFDYFGAAAGDRTKGYYSYDLGAWHIIVLNTYLSLSTNSAQDLWLKADLKANPKLCTMVIGHHPRYYAGSTSGRSSLKYAWRAMYQAAADVYVSSHTKIYERFAPQDSVARADPYGVTQFIVGTGGISHGSISSTIAPNSLVRDRTSFGVMKFTLHEDSYDWEFIPIAGNTFTDAGSAKCHRGKPPIAIAGGPYQADGAITFDASRSTDPGGNLPLTYAWDFGDGQTAEGVTATHAYASDGAYEVKLTVTNSLGAGATVVTTATSGNVAPAVHAGRDWSVAPGEAYPLSATFSDPGVDDGPWTYFVDWGDGTVTDRRETTSQSVTIVETHAYASLGEYTARVTVIDKDGGIGSDDVILSVVNDPPAFLLAAGDLADCGSSSGDERTAALLDGLPGIVAPLGDNAYPDGTAANYAKCYEPSWGRHKARTRPSAGNHEYHVTNAADYFAYFGAAAGEAGKGYYSYDLGAWHIVVLNTNLPMGAGTEQERWLRADLAANPKLCTLAYWHHARFNSSRGSDSRSLGGWRALYDAGADVILSAHEHNYERFAPQTPDGIADPERGLRQFVVGTGGHHSLYPFETIAPNSEVRIGGAFGVLKLTLYAARYEWEFIPVLATSPTDAGSGRCH